jgi:hypothetical protein
MKSFMTPIQYLAVAIFIVASIATTNNKLVMAGLDAGLLTCMYLGYWLRKRRDGLVGKRR